MRHRAIAASFYGTWRTDVFIFNKDYKDLLQVVDYLPRFMEVLVEIEGRGQYRYNDSFKGRIPGIEGPDEDAAIYLLQGLERDCEERCKIVEFLNQGYEPVTTLTEATKFRHIIVFEGEGQSMAGGWSEFRDARLVPYDYGPQSEVTGRIHGVLPKGKRTIGHAVNGRQVLALR